MFASSMLGCNAKAGKPHLGPGTVARSAADRPYAAERRSAEFRKPAIAESLDGRDAFEDCLKKRRVPGWSRL